MSAPPTGIPRVDLLPRAERERRSRRRLARVWVAFIVVSLVLATALVAGAWWLQHTAQQRLEAEQAKTGQLAEELRRYDDVSGALRIRDALTAMRADAAGHDTEWVRLLRLIQAAVPAEARVIGFELTAGPIPTAADRSAAVGPTGTYLFEASAPIDLATAVRALRGAEGVLSVDARSLESDGERHRAELSIEFDQTVYTGVHEEVSG